MREIYRLIRQLGVTSKYKGYYFLAEAVKLSVEMQGRPIKITKDIYPTLARKFKSTPVNIEHNIRTVLNLCWSSGKETLNAIAGYSLRYKPTNSEFIDILAYYLSQAESEENQRSQNLIVDDSIPSVFRGFIHGKSTKRNSGST